MKIQNKILFLIIAILIILFINPISSKALIQDDADIFSYADEQDLNTLIQEIEKRDNMMISIYTFEGMHSSNSYSYDALEDFLDEDTINWYNKTYDLKDTKSKKSIVFSVDMNSRTLCVMGFDKLSKINFHNSDGLIETLTDYFASGNYSAAAEYFIRNASSSVTRKYISRILISFVISLVISIIVCISLFKTSKGKVKTTYRTYLSDKSRLVNKRDIFIRTDVSKVKRESSSSGGHSGGGGHSHGSGGHGHF